MKINIDLAIDLAVLPSHNRGENWWTVIEGKWVKNVRTGKPHLWQIYLGI